MNRHLAEAERLLRAGDFESAEELCRKALRMNRDTPVAMRMLADCHYNLGVASLHQCVGSDAALAHFRRALELDPAHVEAANNLGSLLIARGERDDALGLFRQAAKLQPRSPRVLANLVRAQVLLGRLDEASASLFALAEARPENEGAYLLAEALLVAEITPDASYPQRTRQRVREKLAALGAQDRRIANPLELAASYFPLSYHGECNIDIAKPMAATYLRWCPSLAWRAPHVAAWKGAGQRIRVGFASRFFRNHSISNTTRGLMEQLDRERFEVTAIRFVPSTGDESARAVDAAADRVVTLPESAWDARADLQAAREAIARLELDVLFFQDIGLEPLSYFLAFARLAPVQLTSFGHPDTTGIPNVDYFLSAALYEPPGAQQHYSERLVELPDVGTLAYYHRPPRVEPATHAALGAADGEHVYLCPQTLQKVQPAMDEIFARIVERDSQARIVLIAFEAYQRRALEERFRRVSEPMAARVRFLPVVPHAEFLARLGGADVVLDTVHFNGQNTTLESFSEGTPVVTLRGTLQRARHGYGLYTAGGFTEPVAADAGEYVAKAVRVASDASYRRACSERIEHCCEVLFDDRRFVQGCSNALESMVAERSRG